MRLLWIIACAGLILAQAGAEVLPQPVTELRFNKPGATQENAGFSGSMALLMDKDDHEMDLVSTESGSGVSGGTEDRCLDLSHGGIVTIAREPELDDVESFTISGWCRNAENIIEYSGRMVGNVDSTSPKKGFVLLRTGVALSLQIDGELVYGNGVYAFNSGDWEFWAVTFRGDVGEVRFYFGTKDGPLSEYVAKVEATQSSASTGALTVGNNARGDRLVKAQFDNVRIHKTALSADELVILRNGDLNEEIP